MSLPPAMNAPIHRRIETSGVQIAGAIAVILLLAVSFLSAQPQAVSDLTAFSGSPEGRVTMRRASPGHGEYGFKRAGNPDSFALTGTNHGKFFTPGIAPYEQMLLYVNNPQGDKVTGKIFDLRGELVAYLVPVGDATASNVTMAWDGKTCEGDYAPKGAYIYQVRGSGKIVNGTVIVVR